MHYLFEPGLFTSQPVRVAAVVGAAVAIVSGVVGVFTVVRGQSFAGHALTDVSTAGGSGAFLIGMNPLLGFVGSGVVGAAVMDLIGVRRVRGRDIATGIVLGAATGLAALFLYLDSTTSATTGASQTILFGSIFTIESSTIPLVLLFGALGVAIVAVVHRPLLLSSVSTEVAAARGVPQRAVGLLFMGALALAVGLSALAIGSILSTALLIGPAATALRLTRRIGLCVALACALGVVSTWTGLVLAYDSFYWSTAHTALPVSFFIVGVIFALYIASGIGSRDARGRGVPARGPRGARGPRRARGPRGARGPRLARAAALGVTAPNGRRGR